MSIQEKWKVSGLTGIGLIWLIISSYLADETNQFGGGEEAQLFFPAPYAFSIWILIFIGLALWSILAYRTLAKQPDPQLSKIAPWLTAAMITAGASVLIGKAIGLISIILSLALLCITYSIGQRTGTWKGWRKWPISLFLAWVSVAAIVNTFLVVRGYEINQIAGLNETAWVLITITAITLIGAIFTLIHREAYLLGVFTWATIALIINRWEEPAVLFPSLIALIVFIITASYQLYRYNDGEKSTPASTETNTHKQQSTNKSINTETSIS